MVQLAPSIYAADYYSLGEQMKVMEEEGISILHLDVMDGQFVPGFSFGPEFIAKLRPHSRQHFDVHLMTQQPQNLIRQCVESGADTILLHWEAFEDEKSLLNAVESIHNFEKKAGIVLNPETELSALTPDLWKKADKLQLMTTRPGRKGQSFLTFSLERFRQAKLTAEQLDVQAELQADGGVNLSNIQQLIASGAETFVVGNGLFTGKLRENIKAYQAVLTEGRAGDEAVFYRD